MSARAPRFARASSSRLTINATRSPRQVPRNTSTISRSPSILSPPDSIPTFLAPSVLVCSFSTSSLTCRPRNTDPEFTFPRHLSSPTPYDVFHFSTRTVTPAEVKARYYDLVRSLHPDRQTTKPDKSRAEEEFKLVIAAYNLLKDGRSKQLYDRAGIGWGENASLNTSASYDVYRNWQDLRYTRRYNPGFTGPGHDRFGWQNQGFYSNQYSSPSSGGGYSWTNSGWDGGNRYASNGVFISTLFVITWLLAGVQYSRLSLQSQKAVERADKAHLNAAKSLNEAREQARSNEGRERWKAFRRRAREQKVLEEIQARDWHVARCENEDEEGKGKFGIGHGGPSGKAAAQERFAKAQASK